MQFQRFANEENVQELRFPALGVMFQEPEFDFGTGARRFLICTCGAKFVRAAIRPGPPGPNISRC